MNLTTDHAQGVAIVRIQESRLMYPLLSEFASTVTGLIGSGEQKLLLDFSSAASLRNMLKRYTGLSPREVRENGGLRCVLHAFRQTLVPPARSAAAS